MRLMNGTHITAPPVKLEKLPLAHLKNKAQVRQTSFAHGTNSETEEKIRTGSKDAERYRSIRQCRAPLWTEWITYGEPVIGLVFCNGD